MNTFTKNIELFSLCLALLLFTQLSQAQVTISGEILNRVDAPVINVPVFLEGDMNAVTFTDENGAYSFSVTAGGNYTITPHADVDPINGVSTFDQVLIFKHIDGDELLESPYQIIAADIDHNEMIEANDTSELRSLIIGEIQTFPSNTSWRFVDAHFIFPNPSDPFETAFPEIVQINNSQADVTDVDFVAIKVGDINASSVTSVSLTPCNYACGHISGNVFYDLDLSCSFDSATEQNLQGWLITATSDDFEFVSTSNEFGAYSIPVFIGTYTVTISPPNNLWTTCQVTQTVDVAESELITIDVPAQAIIQCPMMEVDLATPFLRRCFDGFYMIQYCNQGTQLAEDVSIEVTFDSLLIINSSSIPWTSQDGNTFTFDFADDIGINECGSIRVDLTISCESELGQTFCSEANVFPNELCAPTGAWDGARLELSGECEDDQVKFKVTNMGATMTEAVDYIVIEDDMIMMLGSEDPILLAATESEDLVFPANGSTWRLNIEQSPNHPLSDQLSRAIEGCGENEDGSFSMGFVTPFPQLTESPATDVDCVEGRGSYDPNDKAAMPEGVAEEHFIEKNIDLEYRIRFQNTGTDTAFTVVIKDTLSEWLDVTNMRPGASSHAYDFRVYGENENIVEFRFSNIMLPDSNVNEAASHGFVKFRIAQQVDNPLGTMIENSAAIYFDFNEPVITNTVFHTIGEDFLEIISNVNLSPEQMIDIKLYPNPVQESATIQLEGIELETGTFILYDLTGRAIRQEAFRGNSLEFFKGALLGGMYLFEIQEQGQVVNTGKLMIR